MDEDKFNDEGEFIEFLQNMADGDTWPEDAHRAIVAGHREKAGDIINDAFVRYIGES